MRDFSTKNINTQILVWLIWLLAVLVFMQAGIQPEKQAESARSLQGVVTYDKKNGKLFGWENSYRWKKYALKKYKKWCEAYKRAKRVSEGAKLVLKGMLTMAEVVDRLTEKQLRYKIGALPVLYALLESLKVRQVINRHCRTKAEVDIGTVALVMILNRLMLPLPLYQVSDWVGQTVLVAVLGVPASKFNDDRLGRSLDALYPHLEEIWLEVVERALLKADIDLSVLFYDLTAFVVHGRYAASEVIDFGFAHNTPSNKRKFKLGLNVTADGHIPCFYKQWSGRTADQATVASNMRNLAHWLRKHGYQPQETLVVGDRAMLSNEIALAYEQHNLRYLAGLRCLQPEHKDLLNQWSEEQFFAFPIVSGENPQYWGRGCTITFCHNEQSTTHKALVVLAGPIRDQLRQSRQEQLQALNQELLQVKASIGQPYWRSLKAVQRPVNARLKASKVGNLMFVELYQTDEGHIFLDWQVDSFSLWQAEQGDGRYLLVTNDWSLSHQRMFQLYRDKDGVEKRFHVSKSDLQVSPLYLHQDQRLASMLLLNMIALLAYSLLERQLRQHGLSLTTRQLINRLQSLTLIETHCYDGSSLIRLTPLDPALIPILQLLSLALNDFFQAFFITRQPFLLPYTPTSPLVHLPRLC